MRTLSRSGLVVVQYGSTETTTLDDGRPPCCCGCGEDNHCGDDGDCDCFDNESEIIDTVVAGPERWTEAKTANTKTEGGKEFPAAAYAYVPDPQRPTTWKLRLWATPESKEDAGQVGRAIAAISPGGYRGQRADIPADALSAVKKKLAAAWKKANPDSNAAQMPATLREAGEETATATDRIEGRVLESKGADEAGGRIFRMQVIAYGDSKNRRRYPEAVLRRATPLYEGVKVYDHHRSDAELISSTIVGLVGSLRNVEAGAAGVEADLHLLPSATHAAEALDASLDAQAQNLPPLAGMSHDVAAYYKPLAGRAGWKEATDIARVHSSDVVADPAAGGRATRMVAGGSDDLDPDPEEGPMKTLKEVLALLRAAKDRAEYDQLVTDHEKVLEDAGLTAADDVPFVEPAKEPAEKEPAEKQLAGVGAGAGGAGAGGGTPPAKGTESRSTEAVEPLYAKTSAMGRMLVRTAVEDAGLDKRFAESVERSLPDRFTESDLAGAMDGLKSMRESFERAGLMPTVPDVKVGQEGQDKKVERLDKMFAGDYAGGGYKSFKEAFADITGIRPDHRIGAEDYARRILRESIGADPYDGAMRSTESATSSTWNLILGDSITRRLVAEYQQPSLQAWRQIVSNVFPLNDFRTQRIDRLGGYGTLPVVNQGAPYQPLTTPGNEEVTYSPAKRGGTEDLTWETIVNDDMRMIQKIPSKLGLAAAQTLFRFVLDLLDTNPTIYDSVALFAAGHNNTATNALSGANMSVARRAMRKQTAYGDSTNVLSIVPKTLIVVSDLEELAFQLTNSAVALPTGAPVGAASDTPNLHANLGFLTVDYWTSTTKWVVVADPNMVPTIEVGFLFGKDAPELFVQNDPTTGAPFNADKIVWKIRHVYGGTVLDYRGFYRGNT